MDLIIVRHGRAGDTSEWTGDDRLRPLTADGRYRTRKVLQRLRSSLRVDLIWTSPWTRAAQTAAIAADLWDLEATTQHWLAGDCGDPDLACAALAAPHAEDLAVMLVGHEPCLGALIGHLIGCRPVPLKKAGLACLQGEPQAGGMTLDALLRPRLVLDLGD